MILSAKPYVEWKMRDLQERLSHCTKVPLLAIIQVAGNKASDKYVQNKIRRCQEIGIPAELYYYEADVEYSTLVDKIDELNKDDRVTGILVQLPLPEHLDADFLINFIDPKKDVDGLTSENIGKLAQGWYCNIPCTPKGVMELLAFYKIDIEGKDVLIINRSNLVGKPLAQLFLNRNATVTIAHSKTEKLYDKIEKADIVVTGVGIPNFLEKHNFTNDTTIIDISINFDENGKMCGDLCKDDYDLLATRCNLTPVPGGVGQTTVMALLDTLVELIEW